MRDRVNRCRRRFALPQLLLAALTCALGLAWPAIVAAQTGANVLVVINSASPASIQVGEYYATARSVPDKNVVRITTTTAEAIERADFERTIEQPIGAWLARHSLQDQVLYVVLTKGVPLSITGTSGRNGTAGSVDSELTLLYRKLLGTRPAVVGRVDNPYFLNEGEISQAKRFTRHVADIYLVTRLDGYTVEDAIGLVDRGRTAVRKGAVVLDQSGMSNRIGDRWLEETAGRLRESSVASPVRLESGPSVTTTPDPVLGYFSWGSNDPANLRRQTGLTFANGALAGMFVSAAGRTFVEPPAVWTPGQGSSSAVDAQSLAADLIREGITGLGATVAEPYLDGMIRPQILFPAYFAGLNLAESFYLSIPQLSWQTIVLGDPLCSPFAGERLSADRIAKGMDLSTELPALFAERRLELLSRTGTPPDALRLLLKADARLARDEHSDVEPLLVGALKIDARLTAAALRLAAFHEKREDFEGAIRQYRAILELDSENVVALNNLAYALAERRQLPGEALPLAEKAFRLAALPVVADTLGWIHHLLGNNQAALPLLEQAMAGAPENADILLHAAIVYAAVDDVTRARQTLDAAERLNPGMRERSEVKALRQRLKLEGPGQERPR